MRTTFFLITLLAGTGVAASAAGLADVVSRDTFLFAEARDLGDLREQWESHPLGERLMEEDMRAFFAPFLKGGEFSQLRESLLDETGITAEEFGELFPGRWAVAVDLPDIRSLRGAGGRFNDFVILAEYAGTLERLREIIDSSADHDSRESGADHTVIEDEYLGAALFTEDRTVEGETETLGGYALAGEILVTGTSLEAIRRSVEFIEGEHDDERLSESEVFLEVADRTVGEHDLLLFMNLEAMAGLVEAAIRESYREQAQRAQPNPMMPTPDLIMDVLALDDFRSLALTASIDGEDLRMDFALPLESRRGIASLITYVVGALPLVDWVPADAVSASATRFDIDAFWTRLETMLGRLSPFAYSLYGGYLQQFEANSGVNVRRALIGSLGDRIVSFSGFASDEDADDASRGLDGLGQVIAVGLEDALAFEGALNTVLQSFGPNLPVREREFLDVKVRQFGDPETPRQQMTLALTGDYVLVGIGNPQMVDDVISRLDGGHDSIWGTEGYRELAADLEDRDAVQVEYSNLGVMFDLLVHTAARMQEASLIEDEEAREFVDPERLPKPLRLDLHAVGKGYFDDSGLFSSVLIRVLP